MSSVVHGGNVKEISRKYGINPKEIIDFSANINPLGISDLVKNAMIDAIDKIEKYPDITYYDLKNSIAKYENIDSENLVLGNGAAEIIFNIVRALKPGKVLLKAPTFGEYEEAILSVDGEIKYHYLKAENNFNLDKSIIEKIDNTIDMIFICNPNNPTGGLVEKELIKDIAKKALEVNAILVVDESFLDFLDNESEFSCISFLEDYKNIIVVKSLTKFFAIPGIRIGYGITKNKAIVNLINKVSVPWSINIIAENGVIAALKDKDYIAKSREFLNKEKLYLYNELNKIEEISVIKPSVNFIMFKVKNNKSIQEELIKKGVLIRKCENYNGLDSSYYRVAVRTREENEILLKSLKEIVK
ncbi:threonine-phosphate decarboxylase CobD [Clostridium carnis]